MRFLVYSTKGGCGKSSFAQQVLCPYVFSKTKQKVPLYELDYSNKSANMFGKNAEQSIIDPHSFGGQSHTGIRKVKDYRDILFDLQKALDNDNVVVDVGGNANAEQLGIDLMNGDVINSFDAIFIPTTNTPISIGSALIAYSSFVGKYKGKLL